MSIEDRIERILNARKERLEFRQLSSKKYAIDFCSNDYLGLSRSAWIKQKVAESIDESTTKNGATGSRLLSGNSTQIERLETKIADFHNANAALIFNSGFDANIGLISTICREENDIIIYDELVHASILQGVKLSGVTSVAFKHNNIEDLERILEANSTKTCFIIIESYYSMDGDKAPLKALAQLKLKHDFNLIVDEAHATGIFGKQGRGVCNEAEIETDCFARIYTYGKAMGTHGAAILGSENLKNYLINFCKPFIYSTAPSPHNLWCVEHSYNFLLNNENQLVVLFEVIEYFKSFFQPENSMKIIGEGPIFGLQIEDAEQTRKLAKYLNTQDIDVRPIVYPTVARGKERIRICLHSYNTKEEINSLFEAIKRYLS